MKLLLKHCDILVSQETGLRCLEKAYLGIDGDTIEIGRASCRERV